MPKYLVSFEVEIVDQRALFERAKESGIPDWSQKRQQLCDDPTQADLEVLLEECIPEGVLRNIVVKMLG